MFSKIQRTLILCFTIFEISNSYANICGTDYQTFNPTSSGLDFTTVHSTQTLSPCIMNFGVFVNHSVNTLTYTKTFTDSQGNSFNKGDQPNDQLTSMDLSFGLGLNKKWDIGVSIPFILNQNIENKNLSSNYKSTGAADIRINSKYRVYKKEDHSFAIALSANQNLIKNNPFTGNDSNPTINLEFIGDYKFKKWILGLNAGYRWRNSGTPVPDTPFETLGDQIIYSAAASYFLNQLDTNIIFEILGAQFVTKNNSTSVKSPNALEWQVGAKHSINHNLAVHFGGGTQLFESLGSPEYRLYAGLNWSLGKECSGTPDPTPIPKPQKTIKINYSAQVLFPFNSSKLQSIDLPDVNDVFDNINIQPSTQITIEGHTDSIGASEYNQKLSLNRANALKNYLLNRYKTLNPNQITTFGRGEEDPIESNANYQGRQKNRRVEFLIKN